MLIKFNLKYLIFILAFNNFLILDIISQSISELPNNILLKAVGTGNTTGHIATLTVTNNSNKDLNTTIGPFYIPSSGQYQPYIVPKPYKIEAKASLVTTVDVIGYCADIRKPPVPSGDGMPSIDTWIIPDQITEHWEPDTKDGWIILPTSGDGEFVIEPGIDVNLNVPGTDYPLGHTIDQYKYPDEAAPIILEAITRIITAFDSLKNDGAINTPFSGNPEKEREAVIQQTLWKYCGALTGIDYTKEDFRIKTVEQFERQSGQTVNPTVAKKLDEGIDDFWNTFNLVGTQAKVLSSSANEKGKSPTAPSLPDSKKPDTAVGNKDLSDIKVQNDKKAREAVDSIGAKAFVSGDDVAIAGKDPSKETIAHEAAHVVQQKESNNSNVQGNGENKNENKPPCECTKLTCNLKTNRGLGENISINPDITKVSPEQKIHYPRVNFDKPQKANEPQEFTVTISELKLECDCTAGPCKMLAAEKDKYEDSEKYTIAVSSMSNGVTVDGKTKVGSTGSHTFSFESKVKSDDVKITFRISSYCKSDDCKPKYCKMDIELVFKDEDVKK